ncbi:MAG: MDR family MFS transporter [Microbacteriaceae bacterium]
MSTPSTNANTSPARASHSESDRDSGASSAGLSQSGAINPGPSIDRRRLTLLFITLMVVMLLASLSQMVLSSALPTIVGELNGVEHMTWVITAYLLASTVMMPIYGKVSDVVGRKPMLLVAITLFVTGSVIGGLAGSMDILIIARVVQGLGGGGLMILSQAAIADVVPARERGKYMGILGAVFAVSSVAGPLLGGWFTEGPGWRWSFWMNVPLGILAVLAVAILMQLPVNASTQRSRVDYLGMALLVVATTGLVLIGTWGGSLYAWDSLHIIGLAIGTVMFSALFVYIESKAAEPVMPLFLFRDRTFTLATIAGLLIAVAMFGAMGYLPTYFQMAAGASATEAGLLMIPLMGALLVTSVVTGQIISATGRYKIIPILGTSVLAVSLALLSTVTISTPIALICVYLGVMGVGLGGSMQILTLIVQNSFPHSMVGTATAANNYFRQVGGSLGAAVVGSVFASRLTELLMERLPTGTGSDGGAHSLTPAIVSSLPDAIRLPIIQSYNDALIPIFIYMVPLAVIAVIALCFIPEKPLASRISKEIPAESLAEGQLLMTEPEQSDDVDLSAPQRKI